MLQQEISEFPEKGEDWTEECWQALLDHLVDRGIVNYKEITALVLGHLNPSQVGTSIASKETFQKHYPPRKIWQAVRQWHFEQSGICADCGSRLELQADHITPKEQLGDDADILENMTLRCRRCNVIRRPSHKQGGLTYLTTESVVVNNMLQSLCKLHKPSPIREFVRG